MTRYVTDITNPVFDRMHAWKAPLAKDSNLPPV